MHGLFAKIGRFFQHHVEKPVLAVAASLHLLVIHVIVGTNRVAYEGRHYLPGSIDVEIARKAQVVSAALNRPPVRQETCVSRLHGFIDANDPVRRGIHGELRRGFEGLFGCSIGCLDSDLALPLPGYASGTMLSDLNGRTYRLPEVGGVQDVTADHIRAMAYVPISPVSVESPYDESHCELNDADLVTVEASFDVAGLYERFHDSFAGDDAVVAWRDATLAQPVFAAVQLQRPTYQIASPYEGWLPPTLHREYLDLLAKQKREERLPSVSRQGSTSSRSLSRGGLAR
jgi:hypothetical protein